MADPNTTTNTINTINNFGQHQCAETDLVP